MSMFTGTIFGRLGADPEIRTTQNGGEVCSVNVATDSGFGDNKVTTWTKLVAFGKTAEFINKFFKRGDQIFCAGEVKLETWTDKNDNERQTLTMVVSQATFGGSKKEESGRESRREEPRNGSRREESRRDDRGGRDGERGARGMGF